MMHGNDFRGIAVLAYIGIVAIVLLAVALPVLLYWVAQHVRWI